MPRRDTIIISTFLVITYLLFGLLFTLIYFMDSSEIYLIQFTFYLLVVMFSTMAFHFAMIGLFKRIREREETLIEHIVLYFFALIVWIGVYCLVWASPSFNILAFILGNLIAFSIASVIILFYSLLGLALLKESVLYVDLSGFVLALAVAYYYEVLLFMNWGVLEVRTLFIVIAIVFIAGLLVGIITLGRYVGRKRGKKYQWIVVI